MDHSPADNYLDEQDRMENLGHELADMQELAEQLKGMSDAEMDAFKGKPYKSLSVSGVFVCVMDEHIRRMISDVGNANGLTANS